MALLESSASGEAPSHACDIARSAVLADAIASLDSVDRVVAELPVESADSDELRQLLGAVRRAQRLLDSTVVRIGLRSNVLAARGCSAPAGELLLAAGEITGRRARSEAARVELVDRFPELHDQVTSGAFGADQLDSLARRTRSLDQDQRNRLRVDRLVVDGTRLPADTFDAALERAVDALAPIPRADHERRAGSEFRHWFDRRTGMGRFSGRLDPERYEAMTSAVDQHTAVLAAETDGPTTKGADLAAAALVELVTCSGRRRQHLPHVTVVVDEETLRSGSHERTIAQTGHGVDLGDAALARLCCDAVLQRVVLDDRGVPIDVGRRYRTATDTQWVAIRALYPACAWSRCGRPLDHCQLHHVLEWTDGGPTDLANLVPLCSEHHHRVHEGRWRIRLRSNRRLVIHRPDGGHHATTDPPTRRPPVAATRYLTTE